LPLLALNLLIDFWVVKVVLMPEKRCDGGGAVYRLAGGIEFKA
jgi:hypothetical protein